VNFGEKTEDSQIIDIFESKLLPFEAKSSQYLPALN
jgi:hypothetical protein